mmetsp:Transcript_114861/g.357791  ORF Transcript_114861/g.357791 Transcript_114861/m.357791 type:complete len:449 (-) Transcript_114861:39-1385(-)
MFAPNDTSVLLGEATHPANLSMANLGQTRGAALVPATNAWRQVFARLNMRGATSQSEILSHFLCDAYLRPFGLCDMWAFMAADTAGVARIKEANPLLRNHSFQVPRPGRPRALVMQGALEGPEDYHALAGDLASFQMSPDFVGVPFYPGGGGVVTFRSDVENSGEPPVQRLVGGGFVEAFAFGGDIGRGEADGESVTTLAPPLPFSLARAMGVSSSEVGKLLGLVEGVGELRAPIHHYWPLTDASHANAGGMANTKLSDGGAADDSGLLPLLQRGVRRVVWLAATGEAPDPKQDLCKARLDNDDLVKAKVDEQVLDKFGLPGVGKPRNRVFRRETVQTLMCQLQGHLTEGTPAVLNFTGAVLRNDWWGIAGGWEAEVLLVYLSKSSAFVGQLPDDTRQELHAHFSKLKDYPHYPTHLGDGELEAHNLLAATSEFFVTSNEGLFRQFLS